MNIDQIKKTLHQLKGQPEETSDFLIDLAKSDPGKAKKITHFYEDCFSEKSSWEEKKAGIYGLLFILKVRDQKYVDRALELLKNTTEEDEVRLWSITGLASAYFGTKHKEILTVFTKTLNDNSEDFSIRKNCFIGTLNVLGIDSGEIARKSKIPIYSNSPKFFRCNADCFIGEFSEINQIISS